MSYTLQIIHASDQEAGAGQIDDILGMSAVMEHLEALGFENTLKLTSGDTFIASPFSNASQDSAVFAGGIPGVADILIQNALGWDAAAVGNHEFGFGPGGFARLVGDGVTVRYADDPTGSDIFPGALFPYLSLNLDFTTESSMAAFAVDGPIEIDDDATDGNEGANKFASSAIIERGGERIGVLAAITPYLNDIANVGSLEVTTLLEDGTEISNRTPAAVQAARLLEQIRPLVADLEAQGINKIILMTHLQESNIEQELARQLADAGINVDVLIGGGSHQAMADSDGQPPLRDDETQQDTGLLLQPYPQEFAGDDQSVFYVNTAANYRYLAQLVIEFDDAGDVIAIDEDNSGPFATDLSGVARLYDGVETIDDVRALADAELVDVVDRIGARIRELDGAIFGQTDVFLEGRRDFVRTEETNLGNLTQDATRWYVQQYVDALNAASTVASHPETIHIAFGNGGGIRNFIGESFVPGGGGDLIEGPPGPNPDVGKEEGDVSALDVSDTLRFDNDLTFGEVTAENLVLLLEHAVSANRDGLGLAQFGGFGQWSGVRFAFDVFRPVGERIVSAEILNDDGTVRDVVVLDGALQGDPARKFGIATSSFTANGGDRYPQVIENRVNLLDLIDTVDPAALVRDELSEGRQQDALGEFLNAFHNEDEGDAAFAEAETSAAEDARIVQLAQQFTPIYALQGASQVSPFVLAEVGSPTASSFFATVRNGLDFPNGQPTRGPSRINNIEGPEVTTVGIVTAIVGQSFYLQDAEGDGDDATSDAILVFAGRNLPAGLAIGDELRVTGTLQERFTNTSANGGTASRERPVTQIAVSDADDIQTVSTGNEAPDAVAIGRGGRLPPARDINDQRFVGFDPETSGLDFLESLEGMRITIQDAVAVSGLNRFNEVWLVADQGADATTLSPRGALPISEGPDGLDFNPESIQLQLPTRVGAPRIDAGDRFGDVTGVLGFSFGSDELIQPEDPFANYVDGGLTEGVATLRGDADTLTVAAYNVLNLDPNDGDGDTDVADFRFVTIARHIVENLGTPDIVALQEIQDNSGSANDGETSADETLRLLANAIDLVDNGFVDGSLAYAFLDTPDLQDGLGGGQPGGNIRNAYLYNPARVQFVEGSLTTLGSQDPGAPNFESRLPLVAEFAFNGETVTVVNVHNASKGGSAPLLGIDQPVDARQEDATINAGVDQRADQMALVGAFVQQALRDDAGANIVALGDFNEFQFLSPVRGLEAAGLTDLGTALPDEERYSFVFSGNAQQLDHILVTDALADGAGYEIVHANAEFFEDRFRGSDHDPVLAALNLGEPVGVTVSLLAGATGVPGRPVGFEVLINGASFGRFEFADPAEALTDRRAAAVANAETFEIDTDFDTIDTIEIVFTEDAGPIANGGFDANVYVLEARLDDETFLPADVGLYDPEPVGIADRASGDIFWNGRLTLSGFDDAPAV